MHTTRTSYPTVHFGSQATGWIRNKPLSERAGEPTVSEYRQAKTGVRANQVSFLQSKQAQPTHQDWDDLAHLLGYLKSFPDRPILFAPTDLQLTGYADAAFNITPDGRSHYGYPVRLGDSLISSKGGRIKSVVRSSTEAEISSVNELLSDLLWCRDVLEELGYPQ